MKEKEVLIIIPAYNEAANIGKVLDQLEKPEISDIADILVMNDASVDATNWLVKARGHALVTHVLILDMEVESNLDISMRCEEDTNT